jgi:hypothetical protein
LTGGALKPAALLLRGATLAEATAVLKAAGDNLRTALTHVAGRREAARTEY